MNCVPCIAFYHGEMFMLLRACILLFLGQMASGCSLARFRKKLADLYLAITTARNDENKGEKLWLLFLVLGLCHNTS